MHGLRDYSSGLVAEEGNFCRWRQLLPLVQHGIAATYRLILKLKGDYESV